MKALKQNVWKPVCFLLIGLMLLNGLWFVTNGHGTNISDAEALGIRMDNWISQINTKGTEAYIQDNMPDALAQLPEGANLVILDSAGKITSKTSEDFIGKQVQLNLMLSPYVSQREDWVHESGIEAYADTRLALLTDRYGGVTGTLRCVASEDVPAVGTDLPKYSEYFPALDQRYYADARNAMGGGWGNYEWSSVQAIEPSSLPITNQDPAIEPLSTPSPAYFSDDEWDSEEYSVPPPDASMAQKVKAYTQWENAQMVRAGNMRLIYRGPAWDGTQLLVIYPDSDAMHKSTLAFHAYLATSNRMAMLLVSLLGLFILALAAWVYVDAKRRGSRPALWGILTLMGNVVAWLVYMLVRPNGRAAKGCPKCRASVKGSYAFCANCGAQLCETCARCGKPLEPSFHYCPHCGKQVEGETKSAPTTEME